jgi:Ca2+/Na+ antiporter
MVAVMVCILNLSIIKIINIFLISSALWLWWAQFHLCINHWWMLCNIILAYTSLDSMFSKSNYKKPKHKSSIVFFVVYIVLMCCDSVRRSYPANIICLGILVISPN